MECIAAKRVTAMKPIAKQVLLKGWATLPGAFVQNIYVPMPCAVECICYHELSEVEECLEYSHGYVTCFETFK